MSQRSTPASSSAPPRLPRKRLGILGVAVVVVATTMTWTFLAMRAVMEVGGSCADGGPYVSAQPCPDGAWMVAVAIPLMLLAGFAGTFAAAGLGGPDLLLPLWVALFSSLGVNFLTYGLLEDPWVWGWIVCGVVFVLMALPAVFFLLPTTRDATFLPTPAVERRSPAPWWAAYAVLAGLGVVLGVLTFAG